jgi:tetratricopeptide (TPR) repeat protein
MPKRIKPLEPHDSIHLNAAIGWLELGNHLEANEELEEIAPQMRVHPDVLEVRWQIFAKAEKWEVCVDIARSITKLVPSRPGGWIQLAYSLRRAKGGGLQVALETLMPVADQFPKVWVIPYNSACYCSQMQRLEEAETWLRKAMAIDETTVKRAAIDDPDLQPLWDSMSGTFWKKT